MVKQVTQEQYNSEDFQKWWERHPWRAVNVNGQICFHRNILLVLILVFLTVTGLLYVVSVDIDNWKKYKKDKIVLTETELQGKYSKNQITRYAFYTAQRENHYK